MVCFVASLIISVRMILIAVPLMNAVKKAIVMENISISVRLSLPLSELVYFGVVEHLSIVSIYE